MFKKEDVKLNKILTFPGQSKTNEDITHLVFEIYLICDKFIAINGYYASYSNTELMYRRKISAIPVTDDKYTGEIERHIVLAIDEFRHSSNLHNTIKDSIISHTEFKIATYISSEELVVKEVVKDDKYHVLWYNNDSVIGYYIDQTPDIKLFGVHEQMLIERSWYIDDEDDGGDTKLASLSLEDIDMHDVLSPVYNNIEIKTKWYQYAKHRDEWLNTTDELKAIGINLYFANKLCSIGLDKVYLYNFLKEQNILSCIDLTTGVIKKNCQKIITQLFEISITNALIASGSDSTNAKNYISSDLQTIINSIPAAIYSGILFK